MRVKAGDKAPFAGTLLTDAALAKLITALKAEAAKAALKAEADKRALQAKLGTAAAVCDAKLKAEAAKAEAERSSSVTQRKLYETALTKASKPSPWYASPYLHFILGSVVSGGLCAAAIQTQR